MLKKPFILLIATIYLAISSGMVMNIHYCMGKVSSVNFGHEKDHDDGSCGKCGMDKGENHCCSDETRFIKLTDSHQVTTGFFNTAAVSAVMPVSEVDKITTIQGLTKVPSLTYFSPPPKTFNKVYLAMNVFRI